MNHDLYQKNYYRFTSYINSLITKKNALKLADDAGGGAPKFHEQLDEYNRQLALYLRNRQLLAEQYHGKEK